MFIGLNGQDLTYSTANLYLSWFTSMTTCENGDALILRHYIYSIHNLFMSIIVYNKGIQKRPNTLRIYNVRVLLHLC